MFAIYIWHSYRADIHTLNSNDEYYYVRPWNRYGQPQCYRCSTAHITYLLSDVYAIWYDMRYQIYISKHKSRQTHIKTSVLFSQNILANVCQYCKTIDCNSIHVYDIWKQIKIFLISISQSRVYLNVVLIIFKYFIIIFISVFCVSMPYLMTFYSRFLTHTSVLVCICVVHREAELHYITRQYWPMEGSYTSSS